MNKASIWGGSFLLAILSGCGGGDSDGSNTGTSSNSNTTTFTAIDGYLTSAAVYIDKNENSNIDSGEYYGLTNSSGQISLPSSALDYPVIVQIIAGQTTDSDTEGVLTESKELIAGKGVTTVTPFSTLAHLLDISFSELATQFEFELEKIEGDFIANGHQGAHALARSIYKILESDSSTSATNIAQILQKSQAIADVIQSDQDRDWSEVDIDIDDNNNVTIVGDNGDSSSDVSEKSWGSKAVLSTAGGNPAVSIDESGNVLAVWVEETIPSSVRASFRSAGQTDWSVPEQLDSGVGYVDSYTGYKSRSSTDVVLSNGSAFAVWPQAYEDIDSMYVSRWDGLTWSNAIRLSDGSEPVADVQVVMDDDSNALAVWLSGDYNSAISVYSSFYDVATGEWNTERVGDGLDRSYRGTLKLTKISGNSIALTWLSGCQLNYMEWTSQGWGSPSVITTNCPSAFNVDFMSDMSPVIVWQEDSDREIIKLAKRNDSGWSSEHVNSEYSKDGFTPDVAVMPNDDIVVTWAQNINFDGEARYYANTLVKRYSDDTGWGDSETLWDLGCLNPTLHVDDEGRMIVMWYNHHTYISHFSPEEGWSRGAKVFGYNGGRKHSLDMNHSGNAAVTYEDEYSDTVTYYVYE